VNGSWADVEPDELDRELDEHLIDQASGRVGWRISIPAMLSYWSALASPVRLRVNDMRIALVRGTKTDPPYITDELLAGLGERRDFALLDFDCYHMVPQARPADTAAVIRKQLERG
jgi:lipase